MKLNKLSLNNIQWRKNNRNKIEIDIKYFQLTINLQFIWNFSFLFYSFVHTAYIYFATLWYCHWVRCCGKAKTMFFHCISKKNYSIKFLLLLKYEQLYENFRIKWDCERSTEETLIDYRPQEHIYNPRCSTEFI